MNLKNRLPFIILILSFMATVLVLFGINYISILISIISLILSLLFSRKNIRILLITIFISISTIFTNIFIIYKENNIDLDIFEDTNILLGTWSYNFDGGTYVFKDDYTYIRYDNSDTNDNYCVGRYEYNYGGVGDNGEIIKQDNNYYYYNFNLNIDSCVISNEEYYDKKEFNMVFGINKNNYNELIFIDKENDYAYVLSKVLE